MPHNLACASPGVHRVSSLDPQATLDRRIEQQRRVHAELHPEVRTMEDCLDRVCTFFARKTWDRARPLEEPPTRARH